MNRNHDRRVRRCFASVCCAVTLASVAVAAHESPQATNRVIRIYLTAATPAEVESAKRTLESANHRLRQDELDLESRHWNPIKDGEPPSKPIDDTTQYLRDSFMGRGSLHEKEHVELVEKREDAQLIVEVLGYRLEHRCAVALIKVSEGDAILGGTLGKLDLHRTGMFLPGFRDRHSYTAEHPYWILEGFRCTRYGPNVQTAANELGKVFNDRIAKDNWEAFSSGLR